MNYVGDNFVFPTDDCHQIITSNSQSSAANDFLAKFLKSKERKNYLNEDMNKKHVR